MTCLPFAGYRSSEAHDLPLNEAIARGDTAAEQARSTNDNREGRVQDYKALTTAALGDAETRLFWETNRVARVIEGLPTTGNDRLLPAFSNKGDSF